MELEAIEVETGVRVGEPDRGGWSQKKRRGEGWAKQSGWIDLDWVGGWWLG